MIAENTRKKKRPYSFYLELVHRYRWNDNIDGSVRIAQSDASRVASLMHDWQSNDVKSAMNFYKAMGTPVLEVYIPKSS